MVSSLLTGSNGSNDCNLKVGESCLTQANLRDICQTIINNSDHLTGVSLNPYAKQAGRDHVELTCFSKCEDDAHHIIEADITLPWLSFAFKRFGRAPKQGTVSITNIEIDYLSNNEYVDKIEDLFGPKFMLTPEIKKAGFGIGIGLLVVGAVLIFVACSGESQDSINYDVGDATDDSGLDDTGSPGSDTSDTTETKKDTVQDASVEVKDAEQPDDVKKDSVDTIFPQDIAEPKDVPIDSGDTAEPKDVHEVFAEVFPQDIPDISELDSETISPIDVVTDEVSPEDIVEPEDIQGELDAAVIPDIFDVGPGDVFEPEDVAELPDIPDINQEDTVEPIDISFQDEMGVDTGPEDIGSELVDTSEPEPDTVVLPDIPVIQDTVEDEVGPEIEDTVEPEPDILVAEDTGPELVDIVEEPDVITVPDISTQEDTGPELVDTIEEIDTVVLPDVPIIQDTVPEDVGPELVDTFEPEPDISEPLPDVSVFEDTGPELVDVAEEPDTVVLPDIPAVEDTAPEDIGPELVDVSEPEPDISVMEDTGPELVDVAQEPDVITVPDIPVIEDVAEDVTPDAETSIDIFWPMTDVTDATDAGEDVGIDAALPIDIMFPPEDIAEEVEVVQDVSETTDTSEPGIEYIDNVLDGFLVMTPYYDEERTEEMPISQFSFFVNSNSPSVTNIPISLEFFFNDEEIPSNGIPLCEASASMPDISGCSDSGFPIGDIGSFNFYEQSPTYMGWEKTWELFIPDATDTDDIVMSINSYPSEGGFYPLGLFVDVVSDGCIYFYSHYACGEYWLNASSGFSRMCIAMNAYSGLPLQ